MTIILRRLARVVRALKYWKKIWRDGGITQVNISQIAHGGILKDKRVLITGGSSGIGLAIAKKCLSEGAQVVITGRDLKKLETAKIKLDNSSLHILQWDVSDVSIIDERLNASSSMLHGSFDILVNNAGILGGSRQFLDLTEDVWDQIYAVNSKGLVFLTQHVVQNWIECKQSGKIINMSSMRGSLGVADGPYGMSKWSLNGLTHGLGFKLAPHGIIVNGIAPGIIATNSISIKNMDVKKNAYLNGVPVSRIGLPEEIAEIALFLMSDAANYIVGQTIICDGGYTLKA